MCGVAGILALDGSSPQVDRLRLMTDALAHRGPDGEGLLALGPLALGHRRLAVIDLSERASQPMRLEPEGLVLSYNGEVYNYRELREELQAAGETFRSESDTEVVLRAYARWGEDAFERFNGMWALAIWNERERTLVLSRDRFGIKPLYLLEEPHRLAFASEPKALLAAFPEAREPDLGVLGRFLHSGVQDDGPRTFFAKIRRLPPGSLLRVEAGPPVRRTKRKIWTLCPEAARDRYDGSDPARTLRELLSDAVSLRLRSDVPVGTCLSGGLDSSAIVGLASQHVSEPVRTFTAVFDDPDCDERAYARAVAKRHGCRAAEVTPNPGAKLVSVLDTIGWFHDEPSSRPGLVVQWHVMALASGEVTVLLDGQGGDELLLGYPSYAVTYLRTLAGDALRGRTGLGKLARDARGLLRQPCTTPLGSGSLWRHLARAGFRRLRRRPQVLAPDLLAAAAAVVVERTPDAGLTPIDRLLRDDLTYQSLPALLHHEDRASMAFSLEARVPFLDHRVVEFALGMDYKAKVDGPYTKSVLREATADLLPPEVAARRDKLGYPTPVRRWLTESADSVRDLLFFGFEERGYVRPQAIGTAWRAFEQGRGDPWLIYRWLTTELWLRRFVDRPPAPPLPFAQMG